MKIGLLGFGVVGRGVYELTRGRDDMQVVKVLRREDMQLPDAKTVRDIRDIVEDDSIDTVVETMGGLHPAYDYVRAAIAAGKNVVTANKAMVCTFYDELLPLVKEKGVCFRCTAAVGGGIGWLSELERARRVQSIREVGGIMNGTCNYILDNMTRQGLNELDLDALDLVILENVGNLVCPAEFDTGAVKNAVILSVPEGDDKPLKYPLMFTVADVLLVNKIDAAACFDFDLELFTQRVHALRPGIPIFPISAKTGEGIDNLLEMVNLTAEMQELKEVFGL
mgnify:CR=1 FL=1